MEESVVLYATDGPIALVTMNRPKYRNAQSYHLLDELDAAFKRAVDDQEIKVIVLRGAGGNFSSGHDLGTPEQTALRAERQIPAEGIGFYENFRHYNYDITLAWRNLPKPTIAMVEGFCIFGGWMIASRPGPTAPSNTPATPAGRALPPPRTPGPSRSARRRSCSSRCASSPRARRTSWGS